MATTVKRVSHEENDVIQRRAEPADRDIEPLPAHVRAYIILHRVFFLA